MTTLHLGVIDLPYADQASYKELKVGKPKVKAGGSMTTGEVADILEDRYHVMEIFYEIHEEKIIDGLRSSYEGAMENILMGAPVAQDPAADAVSGIENDFRTFLTSGEIEKLGIPGVPTQAAKDGVSFRFKRPYAKRKPRPSFVNTGLYEASFRAWVV